MDPNAKKLRDRTDTIDQEVAVLQDERRRIQNELSEVERRCKISHGNHRWGETKTHRKHIPGYTIPGDEPGTMGVDFRGPCHVPPKTEVWYTRECVNCGKVERTDRTKPSGETVPAW